MNKLIAVSAALLGAVPAYAAPVPLSHELFVWEALGELCSGPGNVPFNMKACDENLIQTEILKKRGCTPPTERWGKWKCGGRSMPRD